ncbi:hypothetical protein [Natronorubrum sp. A-ect3]|uniref:hypothetical protein n=1 Tax=Natronorubrum sp. A-ect3 TaxID=3242698 RepID=UPI00359DC21C
MEDLSTVEVGDTVEDLQDNNSKYRVVEKETSSVGKINAVIVERIDGEGEGKRLRIPQTEWGDTWTA